VLQDALLKLETGQKLSGDESEMLTRIISQLSPEKEVVVEAEDKGNVELLALKKKKLELLMKGY
jgi:DNA helicase HerA-like ATPase